MHYTEVEFIVILFFGARLLFGLYETAKLLFGLYLKKSPICTSLVSYSDFIGGYSDFLRTFFYWYGTYI